jgi:outer membrane protein TolC
MPGASTSFSWSTGENDTDNGRYSAGLSANQTISAGGNNYLGTKSALLSRDGSRNDLADREAALIYNVKLAFYSVLSSKSVAENANNALRRTEDQMELVMARDELGLADPTEVTQIKVSLAQTRLTGIQTKNTERKSIESLLMLLSMPFETEIELVEPQAQTREFATLDDYLDAAINNSPQVSSAELARRRARLSNISTWSAYIPGVSASYSYNWSNSEMPSTLPEFDDEASWSVGLSANWTIFAGTSRIARIRSANSSLRDAETNLKMVIQSIEASVRDAYRQSEESGARIDLAEARVEDARLNAELFNEKFKLGDSTLFETLEAELSLREAEDEEIGARFDYNMAIAELARWSGIE